MRRRARELHRRDAPPLCDAAGHETEETGISYLDRDQLVEAVVALDAHGFQVHMHAIGDRAVRNALDACEAARASNGARDSRHHVAHLQASTPRTSPGSGSWGVIANCQPYWAQHDPQMDELTDSLPGAGPGALQVPVRVAPRGRGHSSRSARIGPSRPRTRSRRWKSRSSRRSIRPGRSACSLDALPLPLALAAFTKGSSFVNHDDAAGSIEVGNRADLIVLDRNLFDRGAGSIADARVRLTLVEGEAVYADSPGWAGRRLTAGRRHPAGEEERS